MTSQTDLSSLDRHRFDTLAVRPAEPSERSRWDEEMRTHHYLGFRAMPGESIRYVALLDGEWVALLGWGSAAWSNGHRDRMIGWTIPQRARRLCYLANNLRYLILPGIRLPHLASKVLALCLHRLSSDWERRYGHPVVFVETFVDPARFAGTCYRAAGFVDLGETRGYRRNAGRYHYHGSVKRIFVRPLRRNAIRLLASPDNLPLFQTKEARVPVKALTHQDIQCLMDDLSRTSDTRKRRGIRHSRISLVATLVCAILSGACHTRAMAEWAANLSNSLKKRLGFRRHPETKIWIAPSEPTLRRALGSIDVEEVDRVLSDWLKRILAKCGLGGEVSVLSIDGKTVRGASKTEGGQKTHILSAFLQNRGIVVAQKNVDEKTNEIPELRALLAPMEIAGQIVTADALHTQTETARFIAEDKKADSVFTVKQNQPTMLEDIESLPWEAFPPRQAVSTLDKGHGRIERRTLTVSSELKENFPDFSFLGHQQVFRLERKTPRLDGSHLRTEVVYGVTSLSPEKASPERLLSLVRGHWGIESLHWIRDVVFGEDKSATRKGSAPIFMALLRNLAIALLRLSGRNRIAESLRHFSWKPSRALSFLGF